MNENEIEQHLKFALFELDFIKNEYISKKNRQKADTLDRAIRMIAKAHTDLMEKWYKESLEEAKKPKPVLEAEPIENSGETLGKL